MAEDRFYQAPSHGGRFNRIYGVIIHSVESDAKFGLAWSLATGWLQNAGVSPHRLTDPGETVGACKIDTIGYHCGGPGNQMFIGKEVTGRAGWTTAQWFETNSKMALVRNAQDLADIWREKGWQAADLRWGTQAEIKAARDAYYDGRDYPQHVYTHFDVSNGLGGTNHWDPGPDFPYDWFIAKARFFFGAGADPDAGTAPGPIPTPEPTPAPEPDKDYLETMTEDEFDKKIADLKPAKYRYSFVITGGTGYQIDNQSGAYESFPDTDRYKARKQYLTAVSIPWRNLADNSIPASLFKGGLRG